MQRATRKVWFVVSPGSELLDLVGPWEVLAHANDASHEPAYALELVVPLGGTIQTRHGLRLDGARSLRQAAARGAPDTIVIAGGAALVPLPASEARMVRWLALHHREVPRLVSICTGAFALGEAGLLDGHEATTHWYYEAELARRFPKASVRRDAIFTHDGRIWTSAGITAGIDLALALVELDLGHAVAMAVAKNLVLFLRRSGGQAQFSAALKRQQKEPPRLRDLASFVLEHLDEELSVSRLARRLGMSVRTLSRCCQSELEESPASLVRRLRLEQTQRLLEETALPLKDIASRTGIGDPSTLWRLFTKQLGITPAEYRERFASARVPARAQRQR